jgi:anti-sigma regulatory factor (Ser/Thr protein kinase)
MTRFTASIAPNAEAIAQLTGNISEFLEGVGVDARAIHHFGLVVDEILTNVGTHGGNASSEATVVIDVRPDHIVGEIADYGRPFDPRVALSPDISASAEDRECGGLGLYLVRQLTSALDYRHDGKQNWTTFCITRTRDGM